MRKNDKKQERYNLYSKHRLKKEIKQRFTTSIIAALDAFEKAFGVMWGYGKDDELTEDEQLNYDLWMAVRTLILDKGHAQRRALEEELSRYDVTWKKWQTNFEIRRDNGDY